MAGMDKGVLADTPVLQNHLVDDLSANNASPSKKVLTISIKLFINHHPAASMAPHNFYLL